MWSNRVLFWGPMFNIFINDIEVLSANFMYVRMTQNCSEISRMQGVTALKRDLDTFRGRAETWQMRFSVDKLMH